MDDDIQLISDGDGLAVIGSPTVVERFLVSEGLPSKDLGLPRLGLASVPWLEPRRRATPETMVMTNSARGPWRSSSGADRSLW
ncbi:hypothetical protein I6A84_04455 [Frankia sp. CNm7]|uniref:Uncharacterized protein n=1 Tax=Frankia nepalensis TaxID=1836974 RepID=A0A937ULW5_9ACTN|nr:hypothetical protein [Frankia nepalensis]MBL7498742.1 hypothetical protein [Frankia nepalensis]MBL7508393.1 hypothetical protein [Frankia nepalensis]MBL7517393.1 hypothetical protein [Frankia nepalensis]MBL7626222.1 hypothetical protein [Frankia nepalensis]